MIVHNFDPVLIDLGIFQIRWYSLAYILGILIGWTYANRIIKLTSINKYSFDQVTTKQFIFYLSKIPALGISDTLILMMVYDLSKLI